MENTSNTNEIDLLEIIRAIGRGVNSLFDWIIKLIIQFLMFIIKYFYVYLICFILCVFSLYIYNRTYNKPVYSSTLIAISNIISSPDIIGIINSLHITLKEGNYSHVASELGCSIYDAMQIKDIEALYLIDKNRDGIADFVDYQHMLETKTVKDSNLVALASEFALKLDYGDVNVIGKVKKGLLNYLHRNKYIQDRDTLNRRQLSALVNKTNIEVLNFDTLQANYNKFIVKNQYSGQDLKSQLLMVNEKDVKLLYKDALKLYSEKQALEQRYELSTKGVISIKTDFIPSLKPINRKWMSYLLYLLFFSFGLTVFVSIIKARKIIINKFNSIKI